MTIECKCGAKTTWKSLADSAIVDWRVTTDGLRNALVWWCPACWARKLDGAASGTLETPLTGPGAIKNAGPGATRLQNVDD